MSEKWKGITIGGVPLKQYIDSREEGESVKRAEEEIKQDVSEKKKRLYHRPVFIKKKESAMAKHGAIKQYTRAELNKMDRDNLVKGASGVMNLLLRLLLTGEVMTAAKLHQEVRKWTQVPYKKTSSTNAFYTLANKRPESVEPLLEIKKVDGAMTMRLIPEACNMTIEQFNDLYNKQKKSYSLSDVIEDVQQLKDIQVRIWDMYEEINQTISRPAKKHRPEKKTPEKSSIAESDTAILNDLLIELNELKSTVKSHILNTMEPALPDYAYEKEDKPVIEPVSQDKTELPHTSPIPSSIKVEFGVLTVDLNINIKLS